MKGIIGFILLVIGLINLTSGSAGLFDWLLSIAGFILLVFSLSGPYKRGKHASDCGGGAHYSHTNSRSDSDYSGGDGGCGGE